MSEPGAFFLSPPQPDPDRFAALSALLAKERGLEDCSLTAMAGQGSFTDAFFLGGDRTGQVIKLNVDIAPYINGPKVVSERQMHSILAEMSIPGVQMPRLIAQDFCSIKHDNVTYCAWSIETAVTGYQTRYDHVRHASPEQFDRLASGLAKAAFAFQTEAAKINLSPWRNPYFLTRIDINYEPLVRNRPNHRLGAEDASLERTLRTLSVSAYNRQDPARSVIGHFDFNLGNVFLNQEADVTGLIDFHYVRRGYPESELSIHMFTPGLLARVIPEYERVSGLTLDQELIYVTTAARFCDLYSGPAGQQSPVSAYNHAAAVLSLEKLADIKHDVFFAQHAARLRAKIPDNPLLIGQSEPQRRDAKTRPAPPLPRNAQS